MTTIQGRITNEHGKAIPEVTILVEKGASGYHDIAQLSNDDGSYKFILIKAGTLTLLFNAPNYLIKRVPLFLESGAYHRLDVILSQN